MQEQLNALRRQIVREREQVQILQQDQHNQQFRADPGEQLQAVLQRSEEILLLIQRYQGEISEQYRIQREQSPTNVHRILEEVKREHARINQTLRASRLCM